ncbi:hypothetical protein D3C81_1616550 [compost metagenome]
MDRDGVLVLALLDQEHHQEGDDGGAGVDDQLPGLREPEHGPGDGPGGHHAEREHECSGRARMARGATREAVKRVQYAGMLARRWLMTNARQDWAGLAHRCAPRSIAVARSRRVTVRGCVEDVDTAHPEDSGMQADPSQRPYGQIHHKV